MSNYTIPCYLQNMKVLNVPAARPNPENVRKLKEIEQDIHTRAEKLLSAGTPDDKVHAKSQYTALERVDQLVDEGTFYPFNTPCNSEDNAEGKIDIVSTSITKGLGRTNGKWAMIIAPGNKKTAGAWVPEQADNLLHGSDTARVLGIPLVYTLNCLGVKLDEQEEVYPNRKDGGMPFYHNSEFDQLGVPITIGIYGINPTGGGYHTISPTVLITHERANMTVNDAGTIGGMDSKPYIDLEGARGVIDATRKMKNGPPGSISIHCSVTGLFCEVYAEESGVLDSTKKYMDYTPAFNPEFFQVDTPKAPTIQSEELYDIVPRNTHRTYNMYSVLKVLLDGGEFMKCKKDHDPEMVTGTAKVNGLPAGVTANRQGVFTIQGYPSYPEYRGKDVVGMGDKLYRQGLIKMNEFVTLCGRDRLPIIQVQNTTGIDVDNEAEEVELPGLGQSLIYSTQSAELPIFEITLRKGTATAHYVFSGPWDNNSNVFSIGTAATEINVMYGKTVIGAMYSRRFVKDQDSGKDLQGTIDKINQLIQHYIDTSIPACCTKAGLVDEIANMPKIRNYVVTFVDAAYQNPKSICPTHQMIPPRIIRGYDENGQNAKTVGAKA